MSAREVDGFLRRYAPPVLGKAGHRRRSQYMLEGPRGRQAVVKFHPEVRADMASFDVRYAVITSAHARFQEERGVSLRPWPPTTVGLLYGVVPSRELARFGAPGPVLASKWVFGDVGHNAEVGAALASALEQVLLPRITSWFDPEAMVQAMEKTDTGVFLGLGRKARAVAMALLDVDEPGDRLARTLELLPATTWFVAGSRTVPGPPTTEQPPAA